MVALTLFGNMGVATSMVGWRNLMNDPVTINGVNVTEQFWRFPLELGLLLCMLYFIVYPLARCVRGRSRTARAVQLRAK
jgi:hypothetical protein